MNRLRSFFIVLVMMSVSLFCMSWESDKMGDTSPVPSFPNYDDSTQWFIVDRHAEADLFYIISTETVDHMVGNDICHYADTYDASIRARMKHEMYAVDSFYSGRLNYFSPYYRQATMQSWVTEELALSRMPLPMSDCVRSWDYYIKYLNHGRPFVLAGYSQGAVAVKEILKHMSDSIANRMVAAYFIGYKITKEDTACCRHIRQARNATDTGVSICFNSVKTPKSKISIVSGDNLFCINPITWRTDTAGARFVYYEKGKNDTLSVRVDKESNLLLVEGYKNDTPMPYIGVPGNYHHMELRFYYPYIRQNMAKRVNVFLKK